MGVAVDSDDLQTEGVTFPQVLLNPPKVSDASGIRVIDGTGLSDPMKHLLLYAAVKHDLPNCDSLLYFPENSQNWALISADRKENGENDAIRRASMAHAAILQPPEEFTLWSIGPGDQFGVKERALIEEHISKGHSFKTFAYSDVNDKSLDQSIEDGERVADELGLEGVEHIRLSGNIYDRSIQKRNKEALADTKVLATSFGFTLQNLTQPVNGYTGAASQLADSLKKIRSCLPTDSRLFSTLDHETNKDDILANYQGEAHDAFLNAAIAHHLGNEIANMSYAERRFVPNTAILNRKGKVHETFAVDTGDKVIIIAQDTTIWNGISAKLPPQYARTAFETAKWHPVMDPVFGPEKQVGCHVYRTGPK